jgi:gas vesicle protein
MRPGNIRWVWFPNPGLEKLALLFQSLLSNKAKARFTIRGTEATLMDDLSNEFAGQGDYRSSENNITLGLTMLCVGLALGALTALLLAPKTGKQMRKTLRRKYQDARDTVEDLGDQASDWVDKGSDWAEKAKQRVAPFSKSFRR